MTTLPATTTTSSVPVGTTAVFAPIDFDASILAGQVGQSSIDMYARDLAVYHNAEGTGWADRAGFNPLAPATFARYRAYLASDTTLSKKTSKPYSPNTINRMLSAVRRVVEEAASQGYLDHETAEAFKHIKGVKSSALRDRTKPHNRTRITPDQMRTMLDAPDTTKLVGLRDRALLATLASSGLRVSELVSLTIGHVVTTRTRNGRLAYKLQGVMGKGQIEGRDAALSVEAYHRIMAWVSGRPVMSQYLFTQINDGSAGNVQEPTDKPITPEAAWYTIAKYAKRAGLENVKPHDFRRFVGTQLAAKDIRQAQKALGHKSIETTARHYVLDDLEAGLTDDLC